MPSFISGWCGKTKIGAASEPPTLTQERKNPSFREFTTSSSDFQMAADTHANEGPVPMKKADKKRKEMQSPPQFCKQGEPMPRRVRACSRALGEPITKVGIAPTLSSASQSTNIVLPVLGSPSLQCHIYPELAVSAVVPAGMRLCFCAGGEQMEQPGPPLSK